MYFWQWVDQQPKGTLTRIQRETGLGYTTLMRARRGEPIAQYETARVLSLATQGEVTIAELCKPDDSPTANATGPDG